MLFTACTATSDELQQFETPSHRSDVDARFLSFDTFDTNETLAEAVSDKKSRSVANSTNFISLLDPVLPNDERLVALSQEEKSAILKEGLTYYE